MVIPEKISMTSVENEDTVSKGITLKVLRLDLIHPVVSGNKLFKLNHYLAEAKTNNQSIVTYGGAYSNHLAATAFACREEGIICKGIVRGEKPTQLSDTLSFCLGMGMSLEFISRKAYNELSRIEYISKSEYLTIREGGFGKQGMLGARDILSIEGVKDASHLITAVGTATTLAGLVSAAAKGQHIIGVPVIKNMQDIGERLELLNVDTNYNLLSIWDEFHFGGYAKKTKGLLDFMNGFYTDFLIPSDFVYTGKMFFGLMQKIREGYFHEGAHIIAVHTGGLQGNNSLPDNALVY